MEKNTKTTIGQLQIGDRFFMRNDADKRIWTKVEHHSELMHKQHHKDWAMRDAARYPLAMKPETAVIFLRHVSRQQTIDSDLLAWK